MTQICRDSTKSLYYFRDELSRAWGESLFGGRIRAQPEDFRVNEILGYEPLGEGDHVWLQLEKTETNTDWLARKLASFACVAPVAVGYAGQKDRQAITRQWFSVDMSGKPEVDWYRLEQLYPGLVRVLQVTRHQKKLRRGGLAGNQFRILVRHPACDEASIRQRVETIAHDGVPNYFGPQRFGKDGANVVKALSLLKNKRVLRDHHKRSLYISACRSFLFNQILEQRVKDRNWNRCLAGDAMMLQGSQSFFLTESCNETLNDRLLEFDIHPSGALWGEGELQVCGETRQLEQNVADRYPELRDLLAGIRNLSQERRSLRLPVKAMEYQCNEHGTVLSFELPSGCFATSVLREIFEISDC